MIGLKRKGAPSAKRSKPAKKAKAAKDAAAPPPPPGLSRRVLPAWPQLLGRPTEDGGWISRDGYRFSPELQAVERPDLRPEALDLLAAEIMDRHIRLGRRGLTVCGPAYGAGVSFIAGNLAVALGQSGVKTLLVDANLHAPGLEVMFRPPSPRGGLAEALKGLRGVRNVIHREILPNLAVLYAGAAQPWEASELIASAAFEELVTTCLRDHECVIFDTPPANRSPDARVVAALTGYALMVSRRDRSFSQDMTALAQQLDQDGVVLVGSVLNAV